MQYSFKPGSHITVNAQVAGEMCERLAAENRLTARDLLDENRPEDAPLHGAFEWDDSVAAEAYREGQARHIINCLQIVEAEKKEPVRAFFNIVQAQREYHHIETILKDEQSTSALLQTALKELDAFRKKYRQLSELAPVFDALDQIKIEDVVHTKAGGKNDTRRNPPVRKNNPDTGRRSRSAQSRPAGY